MRTTYGQQAVGAAQSAYYSISSVPIPADIQMEVGGMTFNDQGDLVVCTDT